jgi:putative transposase
VPKIALLLTLKINLYSIYPYFMLKTVEMKLYLTPVQESTLQFWLRTCCWLYNRALEQRIKAYKRRGETIGFHQQCQWLTRLRERMPSIRVVPTVFARDALRRVDRGMKAFFRRLQAKAKPGFPRFRSHTRYNSLECLAPGSYVRPGDRLSIPKLGLVRFRAGRQTILDKQKLLRLIRSASGWYAQMLIDDGLAPPPKGPVQQSIGIDMGLDSFATLSDGTKIGNPRFLRNSERKLKRIQQRLSRKMKGSRNRRKAGRRVAHLHERITAQRKDFAHRESRKLVERFDLIGFEQLNIKGLARSLFAKSIKDAAWGMFLWFVTYKAANAGKYAIGVIPNGTSQECPFCGAIAPKRLSERVHRCVNGCPVIDRDHASGMVIHARALGVAGATACGGAGLCRRSNSPVSHAGETGSLDGATHH